MCLVTILFWGHPIFLFKYILKIGLAGKAEIITDLDQALVGIGQKAFRFFQLASHDKAADLKPKFFFKMAGEIGTAPSDVLRHICDLDRFIDVVGDILDAVEYFPGHPLWDFILRYPFRKIYEHGILQIRDMDNAL